MPKFRNYLLAGIGAIILLSAAIAVKAAPSFSLPLWRMVRATLVKEVDNPAQRPVQVELYAEIVPDGQNYGSWKTLYTVPPGKRLVVKYVYVSVNAPDGQHPAILFGQQLQAGLYVNLVFPSEPWVPGYYFGKELVRIYYGPGEPVQVRPYRALATGDARYDLRVHGYLVDLIDD